MIRQFVSQSARFQPRDLGTSHQDGLRSYKIHVNEVYHLNTEADSCAVYNRQGAFKLIKDAVRIDGTLNEPFSVKDLRLVVRGWNYADYYSFLVYNCAQTMHLPILPRSWEWTAAGIAYSANSLKSLAAIFYHRGNPQYAASRPQPMERLCC